MADKKEQGPIEILCQEIGTEFDERLEKTEILVAFVSVLVAHITHMHWVKNMISKKTGKGSTSTECDEVLRLVQELLASNDYGGLIDKAAEIHNYIHQVHPDAWDAPCDHLIDMLSSCVSAIRFGLEKPCHSRHAADAAGHIWKIMYGVSLFDSFTPGWCKQWIRAQLDKAIISRLSAHG